MNRKIAVYGAGAMGKAAMHWIENSGNTVSFILDGDEKKAGKMIDGVEIVPPYDIERIGANTQIVVAISAVPFFVIYDFLKNLGYINISVAGDFIQSLFPELCFANIWWMELDEYEDCINIASLFDDEESKEDYLLSAKWFYQRNEEKVKSNIDRAKYFPDFIVEKIKNKRIMLDTSILDGEFAEKFTIISEDFEKIYAGKLHPNVCDDEGIFKRLKDKKVELFDCEFGSISKKKVVKRYGIMDPYTDVDSSVEINVYRIDELFKNKKFEYLRVYSMSEAIDIIKGATESIGKWRPIISINVGHYKEDFIELPRWVKDNLKDYTMLFRMHSYQGNDAIVYILPNEKE